MMQQFMLNTFDRRTACLFETVMEQSIARTLRHSSRCLKYRNRSSQRRWAQVHDIRFLNSHQKPADKIIEKFRSQLAEKAKEWVI